MQQRGKGYIVTGQSKPDNVSIKRNAVHGVVRVNGSLFAETSQDGHGFHLAY